MLRSLDALREGVLAAYERKDSTEVLADEVGEGEYQEGIGLWPKGTILEAGKRTRSDPPSAWPDCHLPFGVVR